MKELNILMPIKKIHLYLFNGCQKIHIYTVIKERTNKKTGKIEKPLLYEFQKN